MPRSKGGVTTRRRHKRILKKVKGHFGTRSNLIRTAKDSLNKAQKYAYVGRKLKKRTFRALWQIRISAAARANGTSYSKLMGALKKNNIGLNRKVLADLALNHPARFKNLVEKVS